MKKYSLNILFCIIIMLHWYNSKTDVMIPKEIRKEKIKIPHKKYSHTRL